MRRLNVAALLLITLIGGMLPSSTFAQDQRCFAETNQCISGVIRAYWEANGGLAVFGYPITALAVETNADGFTGPTQWFERDRLEDHNGTVMAGRLGAQKLALENRPWETAPKVTEAAAGCRFFAETGHSLCPPFRAYWESNGGLARFGYPVTEAATETNATGFTGTVQWFERRRMEAHPENAAPFDVLLGLLGSEVLNATPAPAPTTFSGDGDEVSSAFVLAPGLYLVESNYTGESNFIVTLLDGTGGYVKLLANRIGSGKESEVIYIETTEPHVLEVQSSGTWNVTFRQPARSEVYGGPTAPTTLNGAGKAVLFVNFPAGLNRFEYAYQGESNFIVTITDLQNRYVGLAANEIGTTSGSRAISIPNAGPYIVNIEAEGSWTINIKQ